MIAAYHSIPKSSLAHLDSRMARLFQIGHRAWRYLKEERVNLKVAAQRSVQRDRWDKSYGKGDPFDETLERNLLTLSRRAERKRKYLADLKALYSDADLRTPSGFVKKLNEYDPGDHEEFTSLARNVVLEKWDPGHRPIRMEGGWKPGMPLTKYLSSQRDNVAALSAAQLNQYMELMLAKWFIEEVETPFFLWLEDQPMCRDDVKERGALSQVSYARSDKGSAPGKWDKLKLVVFGGNALLQMVPIGKMNAVPEPADTRDYRSEKAADGRAAYAWSEGKELFIAEHRGKYFHHSTFVSGTRVRCAGMIEISGGKVVYADNFSGHYRPNQAHFERFVRFLRSKNAFASNASIKVAGIEGSMTPSLLLEPGSHILRHLHDTGLLKG
jgi:hypothetical protein